MDVPKLVSFVRLLHSSDALEHVSDITHVRVNVQQLNAGLSTSVPWAMEMKAISVEEPSRLVCTLTGGILGCGGWVLSRGADDSGLVSMLFEFERQACLEIYSVLVAAGLNLSRNAHIRFTELCQCTRNHQDECGTEIASVDLEIQTVPIAEEALRLPFEAA